MVKTTKSEWGTKEWSPYTLNCITGCINDCLNCYCKGMAILCNELISEKNKMKGGEII